MAHEHFYRIKAAALAWELAQERLGREVAMARAKMQSELAACGLDPAKNYALNDETQDITEAEPQAASV